MDDPGFESDYAPAVFLYCKTPSPLLNRCRGSFDLSTLLTTDSRYRSRTPFSTIPPLPNQSLPTRCNAISPTIRCERTLRASSYLADKTKWDVPIKVSLQSNQIRLHSRTLYCDGWNQPWRVAKCCRDACLDKTAEGTAGSSLTAGEEIIPYCTELRSYCTKQRPAEGDTCTTDHEIVFFFNISCFTVFVTARQWTLSQARRTHSTTLHAVTY